MSISILSTKLYIPKTRRESIIRSRLFDRLNEGSQDKLLLVSAPAGFGKTTLISEWVATIGHRAAWLSLDEQDSDPIRFWVHFIAALQTISPEIGKDILNVLQSPQPPSIDALLVPLLNEIDRLSADCVMVLDDYHLVENPAIDEAVAFFLKHLPSIMYLIITTREDPQLPLASLRARQQMTEIRVSDLRFTLPETTDFLNQTMGLTLTVDDIAILDERTEGWITGLQLAALALARTQSSDIMSFIRQFSGSHRFVLDYLIEEILNHQPNHIRQFLLQTSILDRLNARLCDAVTGQDNGADILETLERGNMFVMLLDDQREWYRYHHLFADALHAHLNKEYPDHISSLHSRASMWYEEDRLLGDAIKHALLASDFDRAANLIEVEWTVIQKNFEYAMFTKWMQSLSDELIRNRPVLCVAYSWVSIFQGDLNTAEYWLEIAERWLDKDEPDIRRDAVVVNQDEWQLLPVTIAIVHTIHAQASRNTEDVIKYGQHALNLLSEDDHFRRAIPAGILALAYWANGELETAYQHLFEARVMMQKAERIVDAISGTTMLVHIRLTQGRLREAISLYEQSLRLTMEQDKPVLMGTADILLGLSELYLEQSNRQVAIQHLEHSDTMSEQAAYEAYQYRSRVVKARLKEIQGDLDGAFAMLEDAELVYTSGIIPDVRPVSALKTRIWIKQDKLHDAWNWAHAHGLATDNNLSYLREFEHITLVRLLMAEYRRSQTQEHVHDAQELLEHLLKAAEDGKRIASVIEILILQALLDQTVAQTDLALANLDRAITLAKPETYVQVFLDEGLPLAKLLGESLKRDTTQSFTRYLLAKFDGQSDSSAPDKYREETIPIQPLLEPLSQRELDVLRLFKTDLSGPDIARELVIALSTVRTHTKGIYRKLDVNNRRSAVRRAEELGVR